MDDSDSLPFGDQSDDELPFAVGELVELLRATLEGGFGHVMVTGEVTSLSEPRSGHRYFTLSDDAASIDCVMWRTDVRRAAFRPEAGDEVLCRGRVSVYPRQGRMQLYVSSVKPVGEGAAARALERLRKRLAAEGLFDEDRKRALPVLPARIGVVTSRTGAALHDIVATLRRRFAGVRIVVSQAVVQGADAPADIVRAMGLLASDGQVDVAIVGRGGGAAEDLAAFNDERVVRAIAEFPVPVVSAVGHEVDVTLADLAADLRAATPTAAAEAAVPVQRELVESVLDLDARLRRAAMRTVEAARYRTAATFGRLRDPAFRIAQARQRVDQAAVALERALDQRHRDARAATDVLASRLRPALSASLPGLRSALEAAHSRLRAQMTAGQVRARARFTAARSALDALSPLAVLERGYALVERDDGKLVRSAATLAQDERLTMRFRSGRAVARVIETETDENRTDLGPSVGGDGGGDRGGGDNGRGGNGGGPGGAASGD